MLCIFSDFNKCLLAQLRKYLIWTRRTLPESSKTDNPTMHACLRHPGFPRIQFCLIGDFRCFVEISLALFDLGIAIFDSYFLT